MKKSQHPCQKIVESLYQQKSLSKLNSGEGQAAAVERAPLQWGRLFRCRSLGSTNTAMHQCIQKKSFFQHGDLLMSDIQETGRGRGGKTWKSFPGKSLAVSMLLNLNILAQSSPPPAKLALTSATPEEDPLFLQSILLSQLCALAVIWLAADYAVPCYLKWPNDVHVLKTPDIKNKETQQAKETIAILTRLLDTRSFRGQQGLEKNFPKNFPNTLAKLGFSSLKLAGILSESIIMNLDTSQAAHQGRASAENQAPSGSSARQKFIIVGLGMNVSLSQKNLAELQAETGKPSSSLSLEQRFLAEKQGKIFHPNPNPNPNPNLNSNSNPKNRKHVAADMYAGLYADKLPSFPSPISVLPPFLRRFSWLHKQLTEQGLGYFAALWKEKSFMIGRVIQLSFPENPILYWRIQDLDDTLFLHLQGMRLKEAKGKTVGKTVETKKNLASSTEAELQAKLQAIPNSEKGAEAQKKIFLSQLPFQPKYFP